MKRGVNALGCGERGRTNANQKARKRRQNGSPLGLAYARAVRGTAHYYKLDPEAAAAKQARDMQEQSAKMAELIGERLAEIVGARAGTALPAVLATVSERFPE